MTKKYDVTVDTNEIKKLFNFMNNELAAYNNLIDIFGPQFGRDYTFFLSITVPMIELFGTMCEHSIKIYGVKQEKLPTDFEIHRDTINAMSNNLKFILSEAVVTSPIIPSIKKYMGMSVLKFYIDQSQTRSRNQISKNFEIEYKTIYNNLTKLTNINKKHLQIDRKSCIIEYDRIGNFTSIKIPYSKVPIIIGDVNLKNSKWNMMILKQNYKISLNDGGWAIELYNISPETYMINKIDRPTGSYIKF